MTRPILPDNQNHKRAQSDTSQHSHQQPSLIYRSSYAPSTTNDFSTHREYVTPQSRLYFPSYHLPPAGNFCQPNGQSPIAHSASPTSSSYPLYSSYPSTLAYLNTQVQPALNGQYTSLNGTSAHTNANPATRRNQCELMPSLIQGAGPTSSPVPQSALSASNAPVGSVQSSVVHGAATTRLSHPKVSKSPPAADLQAKKRKELPQLSTGLFHPEQDPTTKHVVGSQGRRGILPSVTSRPATAPSSATSPSEAKTGSPLLRDEHGKFLCPHCNKPYLHVKHLKRHMLRHTGVRPYECALCHDTFSRSDILKRHFEKCSARRGNPTGENHLAFSRANRKARQQEQDELAKSASATPALVTPELQASTSMPLSYSSGNINSPIDLSGIKLEQNGQQDRSQATLASQLARSNSFRKTNGPGSESNRGSTSSLNTSVFDASCTFSTGHITPDSVTSASGAVTPYNLSQDCGSGLSSPAQSTLVTKLSQGLSVTRPATQSFQSEPSIPTSASSSTSHSFPPSLNSHYQGTLGQGMTSSVSQPILGSLTHAGLPSHPEFDWPSFQPYTSYPTNHYHNPPALPLPQGINGMNHQAQRQISDYASYTWPSQSGKS